MKEKNQLMTKIYGFDCLSIFLLFLISIFNLIFMIYPENVGLALGIVGWVLLLFVLFRTFSPKKEKRWDENLRFLDKVAPSRDEKEDLPMIEDKKNFKYFDCPECNLRIRVPKGKGRIEITCPKCDAKFIKKT
ncbi:MAG: hypothetical protein Q4E53_02795 [Eubacteriales bacterium]|nr:hypothetical protein [Eubacteriales bacterium]